MLIRLSGVALTIPIVCKLIADELSENQKLKVKNPNGCYFERIYPIIEVADSRCSLSYRIFYFSLLIFDFDFSFAANPLVNNCRTLAHPGAHSSQSIFHLSPFHLVNKGGGDTHTTAT